MKTCQNQQNDSRNIQLFEHFIWLSATCIDNKFEHETSECEICSTFCHKNKELCLAISLELPDTANSDLGFLRSLIDGEESWVYSYDPETKMQSSHWKTPNLPQANVEVMLIVFFYIEGIVRAEFMPQGTTFNSEYYKGLLAAL
jgi:hypothetical protein